MKWKSFLAIILVALLLTACSAHPAITGDAYVPDHDHQVSMMTERATEFVETETGFYYEARYSGDGLRYIEKDTMEEAVLCDKPNCTHSDDTCNAWVNIALTSGLFLYQDKLYYVSRVQKVGNASSSLCFMQQSLDGNEQKEVWELSWDTDAIPSGTIQYYMMHRGKLYYVIQGDSALRGVYEYDLHTKKCKEILQTEDYVFELKGIGDHIFWLKHDAESTEDTASIVQYHVPSGKIVKEWTDTFSVVPNEENLYFLQLNDTRTNKKLVQTDRVGGNLTETGIEAWTVAVDDTYIYAYDTKVRGWDKTLTIYRIGTWEQVDTIEIPGEQRVFLMPSTDGKIIAWENPAEVKYYLEKDEIGTGNLQWHEIKKIN